MLFLIFLHSYYVVLFIYVVVITYTNIPMIWIVYKFNDNMDYVHERMKCVCGFNSITMKIELIKCYDR